VASETALVRGLLRVDDLVGAQLAGIESTYGDLLPVSNANEGRIRYNRATNKWEASENGGAYAVLVGGTGPTEIQRTSTDAGAVELTTDGGPPAPGNRLIIAAGSCKRFLIEFAAYCAAGTNVGQIATAQLRGAIKNVGGVTTIVGAVASDLSNSDLVGWTCVATADSPNSCLAVTFTGIVGVAPNLFVPRASVYLRGSP
jgi:hypothetical protein